jgi:hypothetical protein
MIAAGRYDWKNGDITAKRFPIEGKGTVEFEAVLIHFNRNISSENAKKQIEEAGYEAAKTEHVLSFGANYPEEQRKFPIVALGSVAGVGGRRHVLFLGRGDSGRGLDFDWWFGDWGSDCRFLAVRKVSRIKPVECLIDCDAPVYVPKNWKLLPESGQLQNRVRGQVKFDPTKVNLHLVNDQENGVIYGDELRNQLARESVYTAHVLDYLLKPENQHLIPEEWKGKSVFFWGTIYLSTDGYPSVRYLYWDGGRWCWLHRCLVDGWDSHGFAAVCES